MQRCAASKTAATAIASSAVRKFRKPACARCRSRCAARIARKRARARSSVSGCSRARVPRRSCSIRRTERAATRGSGRYTAGAHPLPLEAAPSGAHRSHRQDNTMNDDRIPSGLESASSSLEAPVTLPEELPILPLRDTVLYPHSFMPLAVARESSVQLIDDAIASGKLIGVFTQHDATVEEPVQDDLHTVGTVSHIHKMFKLPDGSLRLIVQGLGRVKLTQVTGTKPYLRARVSGVSEAVMNDADRVEIDALMRNIKTNFQKVVSLSPLLSEDLQTLASNISEPGRMADFIASSLTTLETGVRQEVLETLDVRARMDTLNRVLIKELEV